METRPDDSPATVVSAQIGEEGTTTRFDRRLPPVASNQKELHTQHEHESESRHGCFVLYELAFSGSYTR